MNFQYWSKQNLTTALNIRCMIYSAHDKQLNLFYMKYRSYNELPYLELRAIPYLSSHILL